MIEYNGLGLGDLAAILTIIFIVLKLCKVINWSLFWVLSPLWIAALIILIIDFIIYLIMNI